MWYKGFGEEGDFGLRRVLDPPQSGANKNAEGSCSMPKVSRV